ncbi:glycosyltransferase family 2 protein [Rubritalea spongiae]|uniref:Glycosyltransferase family 2 protein n=1 Tax=Rubritalea spongiae TaxID=430797 RepID=A0ABW5E3M1_9BACT
MSKDESLFLKLLNKNSSLSKQVLEAIIDSRQPSLKKKAQELYINYHKEVLYEYCSHQLKSTSIPSPLEKVMPLINPKHLNECFVLSNIIRESSFPILLEENGRYSSFSKEFLANLTKNEILPTCSLRHQTNGHLISVIVCGYNCHKTLALALNSLINQSYKNLQIIYIDDASEDDSFQIACDILKSHSPRNIVHKSPIRRGVYRCRNIALDMANGSIITFHDADDWSHSDKIAIQAHPLQYNPLAVASSSRWIKYNPIENRFSSRKSFPIQQWNCSSFMFLKSAQESIGYYDEKEFGADSEFVARMESCFTPISHKTLADCLSIGLTIQSSLTNSQSTGFNKLGWSLSRQLYTEQWKIWHTSCFIKKQIPYLPKEERIRNRCVD